MGGVAAIIKSKPEIFKPVQPAPTVAEVSQSKAADAYDPRKAKAKGRSSTIMTSSKGVEDDTLTLGRKSLLGK
jgi:hypothetical protein